MGGAGAGVGACSGCVGGGSAGVPASGGDEKRFDMNIPPMNPLPAMARVLRRAGAGRLMINVGGGVEPERLSRSGLGRLGGCVEIR